MRRAVGTDGLDVIGEMSARTHVVVIVATVVCVAFILRLVRRHGLRSKYSLLWLTLGTMLAVVGLFPGVLVTVSRIVGIHYPPATFLAFAVGFLILVVVHFSWELSRLEERTRILAESAALLDSEVRRLRDERPAPGEARSGEPRSGGAGDTSDPATRSTEHPGSPGPRPEAS